MIRFIDCAVFDGQLLDIYSIIAIKIIRGGGAESEWLLSEIDV